MYAEIEQQTGDPKVVETIKENVQKVCEATMVALSNFVLLFTNPQNPESPGINTTYDSHPFQIFGFDIMIDSNLKAWLIEIYENPTMNTYICKQEIACNHRECPVSPVDQLVKKSVLSDAVNLMLHVK